MNFNCIVFNVFCYIYEKVVESFADFFLVSDNCFVLLQYCFCLIYAPFVGPEWFDCGPKIFASIMKMVDS